MLALDDQTRYASQSFAAMGRDDQTLLVAVVTARFVLPAPGIPTECLRLADEQSPASVVDEYWGEPGASSLRYEGQSAFTRPGTDIYVNGYAWAPGGRKSPRSVVAARVGPYECGAAVVGDRVWCKGAHQLVPCRPASFVRMPIRYERCFGGTPSDPSPETVAWADLNPVGCGLHERSEDALGQPLPNFEDPRAPIQNPLDRRRPAGLGPVPRHWSPRKQLAGTYDQAWVEERAPLWPTDLDDRFFCAGAPGLVTLGHLVGGEPVVLVGMSPDGDYRFVLPRSPLMATFRFRHRKEVRAMALDAISLEPEDGRLTMTWRASVTLGDDALHHEVTEIRHHSETRGAV